MCGDATIRLWLLHQLNDQIYPLLRLCAEVHEVDSPIDVALE